MEAAGCNLPPLRILSLHLRLSGPGGASAVTGTAAYVLTGYRVRNGQAGGQDDPAARSGHRQAEEADEREVRERGERGRGQAAERGAGQAA